MQANINGFSFMVSDHGFWHSFNSNWEIATKRLYAKYTAPNKTVIDVGAWIGPTVLIGYANNAQHIYAVEADPVNTHILNVNCKLNFIEHKVTIINRCLFSLSGEVLSFGKSLDADGCTSTMSFGGPRKVLSSTLMDIIKQNQIDIDAVSLLKIDIEGSELFLVRDLIKLAEHKGLTVLLSLHPLFWHHIPAKPEALKKLLDYYDFYTEDEEPFGAEDFERQATTQNCLVVLKPKQA